MDWRNNVNTFGNCRRQHAHENRKSNRDRRDRAGLHDKEKRPTKKESCRRPISLAQENILATGARHHRGEFRATQRARNC